MGIKVSIIVPVYNVEKYLVQCIESILVQKLNNYEVILIDDGSTDNSGKICDEYSNKYNEIVVIHQENTGLSGARNTGIKVAKGEYLMFVDSDDYIYSKIDLGKIVANLNGDIIQYKWIYYYDKQKKYMFFKDNVIYDDMQYEKLLYEKVKDGTLSISACDKFVKRSIIIDNKIFFKEGLLSEDIDWSLNLYLHTNSLKVINENIYVYRQQRSGSITNIGGEKSIKSLYYIIKYWYDYSYMNEVTKNTYLNYLAYQYVILLVTASKNRYGKGLRNEIYSLRNILNYSENYKVKLVNKIFKLFGYKIGIMILKIYLLLRSKGLRLK